LPDTSAPTAPTNLNISNLTTSSLRLNWIGSIDDIKVTHYNIYKDNILFQTISSNNTILDITNLTANTAYKFFVNAKDAAGNISKSSDTLSIKTPPIYCSSAAYYASYYSSWYINNVNLYSINNQSARTPGGYADYTHISTKLTQGKSYSLSVSVNAAYRLGYSVWIDYNINGVFESNELVLYQILSASKYASEIITIPTTSIAGPTRMRVVVMVNGTPVPCGTFGEGEVEDYTVIIEKPQKALFLSSENESIENPVINSTIYPNPTRGENVNVSINSNISTEVFISVLALSGKVVLAPTANTIIAGENLTSINITGLNKGVYYVIIQNNQIREEKKLVIVK